MKKVKIVKISNRSEPYSTNGKDNWWDRQGHEFLPPIVGSRYEVHTGGFRGLSTSPVLTIAKPEFVQDRYVLPKEFHDKSEEIPHLPFALDKDDVCLITMNSLYLVRYMEEKDA